MKSGFLKLPAIGAVCDMAPLCNNKTIPDRGMPVKVDTGIGEVLDMQDKFCEDFTEGANLYQSGTVLRMLNK